MTRHLLKPRSGEVKQVFAGEALEAVLAAAQRPPSNEDSLGDRLTSLGGLRRSFVTDRAGIDAYLEIVADRILTMIAGPSK